jgi:tetratricopeptide (TPR) repeat protein
MVCNFNKTHNVVGKWFLSLLKGGRFGALLLGLWGCATLADWTAPRKLPAASQAKNLVQLDREFWSALHLGDYGKISGLITRYKAVYAADPNQAKAAVRLGFLHVWRLSEWSRLKTIGPELIDDAALCKTYFAEAAEMLPKDARLAGFSAACSLAQADISKNERNTRRAYFDMLDAVEAWPEFNGFTAGYVLGKLPYNHERYDEGVEFLWRVLDECFGEEVNRKGFDVKPFLAMEVQHGAKRACWNSEIAPHNFEGFFLNMGDMLVKQGNVEQAKMIYNQAKSSKDYQKWPYKHILESRLQQTERLVTAFRQPVNPPQKPRGPVIMFYSPFACTGCHQGRFGKT